MAQQVSNPKIKGINPKGFFTDEENAYLTKLSHSKSMTDSAVVALYAMMGGDLTGATPSDRLDMLPVPKSRAVDGVNNPDIRQVPVPKKKGGTRMVDRSMYADIIDYGTVEGQKLLKVIQSMAGKKGSNYAASKAKATNRRNYLIKCMKQVHDVYANLRAIHEMKNVEAFILESKPGQPMLSPRCIIVRQKGKAEKALTIASFISLKPKQAQEDSLEAVMKTGGRGADDGNRKGINIEDVNELEDALLGVANYLIGPDQDDTRIKGLQNLDPSKEDDREILKSIGEVSAKLEELMTEDFQKKVQQAMEFEEAEGGQVEEEGEDEEIAA